jgi:tripartite-type tricarboxylate transporter receptor subunit TctC
VSLFKKLNYDPVKDFTPIARLARRASCSWCARTSPRRTEELHRAGATQPGSSPAATARGLAGVARHAEALGKLDIVEVPYKGIPQTVTDTMGGSLHFTFVDLGNALAQAKGGKLRGLGVTIGKAQLARARLPAIAEELPGYELIAWFALVAPAKMPTESCRSLHDACQGARPSRGEGEVRDDRHRRRAA